MFVDFDALVVPVGGGGLIGGIAVYAKWKRPSLKIIGAEPKNVDDAYRSKKCGSSSVTTIKTVWRTA